MRLCERLLVSIFIFYSIQCDSEKKKIREGRHFLALLGFRHGYKIGQDFALQYPSYILAPIVIVPSINQQQSVNIQSGGYDENYQENGGSYQSISSAKIISALGMSKYTAMNNNNGTNNRTVINIKHDKDNVPLSINNENAKVKQGLLIENVSLINNITDPIIQIENNTSTDIIETVLETNTTNEGYPPANYENQLISTLNLTTDTVFVTESQELPPVLDNRWQNFSSKANLSDIVYDDNVTMINELLNNTVTPSSISKNITKYPEEIMNNNNKGPYPSAWYNNAAIDQLSITTNRYTNESPLPPNDGWGSYSLMNTIALPSGFKPLAGLYYDGYLHRPLKKIGFSPQNYWH